jgi:transcription initiation factor TFIID subunit 6
MRFARALLTSPHVDVAPYLHQLLPPIVSCVVSRQLCARSDEDHWALRDS